MKCFDEFPQEEECPICGTNKNSKCVLIGIDGTEQGNIMAAKSFHLDCIDLRFKDGEILYQIVGEKND